MSNESLIAYENAQKAVNLTTIETLETTIGSVDDAITQMNNNITAYNAQKNDLLQQITDIEDNNILIDEIITILSE